MSALWLIPVAFITSVVTAIIGMGGGLLLLAVMPGFLPISAVVPVHGVVQFASNGSRLAFGWRSLVRPIAIPFACGAVVGAALGAPVVDRVPVTWMPMILGAFILAVTWIPRPKRSGDRPMRRAAVFGPLGLAQAFVSLFVGATGPLNGPFLIRAHLSRDETVVTAAAMMMTVHVVKIIVFGALGFAFGDYAIVALGMIVAATAGSWVGTKLRITVPEKGFRLAFRVVVTLLALRLIVVAL